MGKTVNYTRIYTCKSCGRKTEETIWNWKKKAQKDKNKCPACLQKRRLAEQGARERAQYAGYGFGPFWW